MSRILPLIGLALLAALLWSLLMPALTAPALPGYDPVKMRLFHSTLPRLATAAVAGFALALAGALFQQVLRNPLASPTTLGISAGAHLALVVATLVVPGLLGLGRDGIALAGSGLVAVLIMGLGARRGFSPLSLVLSGLVISLWCGALAAILAYLNDRAMTSLFIWGAGSLSTLSWDLPLALGWKTGLLALGTLFLLRPLGLLDMGEQTAASLGLPLAKIRALVLAVAVALSALVTSAVGVIGFIGLMALLLGREPDGSWAFGTDLLALRLPRVLTALAAGAMLAVSGTLLQRLTGNEMASPEVLGISAGATLGLGLSLFVLAAPGLGLQLGFAGAGAFAVLAVILLLNRRAALAPERVLLAGIALSALVDAFSGLMAATGDPRALALLRWMSGSTYNASLSSAATLLLSGAVMISLALASFRWLSLLPMGAPLAGAIGVPVGRARLWLFTLAGGLSAVATLGVGPLSFVGLMAPHLARETGLTRAWPQTAGAALIGASLLVLADWLGRVLIFPWQIPAGLLAALTGAPFLIFLLSRRGRT